MNMSTIEIMIRFLNSLNTQTHTFLLPSLPISVIVSPALCLLSEKHYFPLDFLSSHTMYPTCLKKFSISTFKIYPELNHCSIPTSITAFLIQATTLSVDLAEITSDLLLCFLLPSLSPRVYSEHISQMAVFKRLVILCRPQLESPRWFPNLSE